MAQSPLSSLKRRYGSERWLALRELVMDVARALPPEGISEPDFCNQIAIALPHDRDVLLAYFQRKGIIWRRIDGVDRRVFHHRPDHLGRRSGRIPRTRPVDAVEMAAYRAFSDGITALVDAVDNGNEAGQQTASETIRIAAERLVRRGVTWDAVRAATRVYRTDAIAALRMHETAFDSRSDECHVDAPPTISRARAGSSLADRILRAVQAAGPGGAPRYRLARVTSSTAADLTAALARLEVDGLLIPHLTCRGGQGSRPALRYTLGAGQPVAA